MEIIKDLGMMFPKSTSKRKSHYYVCKCECGNEIIITKENLKKTSGCSECQRLNQITHNKSKTRLYKIWIGMKSRCYNKNNTAYSNYGGRGFEVCFEWKNSFENFEEWSNSNGYKECLTLDRRNNNTGYRPQNCRWVSRDTQAQNTRVLKTTNTSGYRGVVRSRKKWLAQIVVNYKYIRIGLYKTKEEAADAYDKYIDENKLEHTQNKRK